MASPSDAQSQAYKLANPAIAYNPGAAICKRWLAEKKKGNFLGVPVGDELDVGNGQRAQVFSSGAIFRWTGGEDVVIE